METTRAFCLAGLWATFEESAEVERLDVALFSRFADDRRSETEVGVDVRSAFEVEDPRSAVGVVVASFPEAEAEEVTDAAGEAEVGVMAGVDAGDAEVVRAVAADGESDGAPVGEAPGETAARPTAAVWGESPFATAAHAVVDAAASTAAPAATVVQRRLPGAVRRPSGFLRDGLVEC